MNGNGKLPGTGARLNDNVGLLDAALEKLGLGAGDERLDDGRVPAGVDDADAQAGAVVLLGSRTLERRRHGVPVEWLGRRLMYELCCRGTSWRRCKGRQGCSVAALLALARISLDKEARDGGVAGQGETKADGAGLAGTERRPGPRLCKLLAAIGKLPLKVCSGFSSIRVCVELWKQYDR